MKERIKKDLPKLVGFTAAMVAVDVISNKSFDLILALLRIVIIIVGYLCFRFVEFGKKK